MERATWRAPPVSRPIGPGTADHRTYSLPPLFSASSVATVAAASLGGWTLALHRLRAGRRRHLGGLYRLVWNSLAEDRPTREVAAARRPASLLGHLRDRRSRAARVLRRSTASEGSEQSEEESTSLLNSTTGPILLLILAMLYGANVPLLKLIESETETLMEVTGPEVLALRFATACLLCLPWMLSNTEKVKEVLLPGAELAFWLWSGYTLQILGLEKTSAETAAICTALAGVTVQTLEVLIEKQPIKPLVVLSSVGVIAGLAIFSYAPALTPVSDKEPMSLVEKLLSFWLIQPQRTPPLPHEALLANVPGQAISIVAAIIFGIHVWRCNRIVATAEKDAAGGDFELALAIVQLFLTTFACMVFTLIDSPFPVWQQVNSIDRLGLDVWLQIALCGVVCTGLPTLFELFAFKVVAPEVASLIYCTIPLWGTLLGITFLNEPYGPQSIAGGLLILVSSMGPSAVSFMTQGEALEEEHNAEEKVEENVEEEQKGEEKVEENVEEEQKAEEDKKVDEEKKGEAKKSEKQRSS